MQFFASMPGFCRSKVIGGDALRTPISDAVKLVICQCVDRRCFAGFLWTFSWKCVVLKSNWLCAQRQRKLLEARFWVSLAYRVMPRLRPASRMLATPPPQHHCIISRSLSHFDILPGLQPLCLVIPWLLYYSKGFPTSNACMLVSARPFFSTCRRFSCSGLIWSSPFSRT